MGHKKYFPFYCRYYAIFLHKVTVYSLGLLLLVLFYFSFFHFSFFTFPFSFCLRKKKKEKCDASIRCPIGTRVLGGCRRLAIALRAIDGGSAA